MMQMSYWMGEIERYGRDARIGERGKALIADLRVSLDEMVRAAKRSDLSELLDDIDHGVELPYGIAEHAGDRIMWTLVRVLESMLPPDPNALHMGDWLSGNAPD